MKRKFLYYLMMISLCLTAGAASSGAVTAVAAEQEEGQEPVLSPEINQGPEAPQIPGASQVLQQTSEVSQSPEQMPETLQAPEQTPEMSQAPEQTPETSQVPEQTPEASQAPQQTPEAGQTPGPGQIPEVSQTPETSQTPQQTPEAGQTPGSGQVPEVSQTPEPSLVPTQTPKPTKAPKKRGWVTYANGQKRYFNKKGEYVTGFKTIDGKRYYFGPKGILHPNCWITVGDKTYRTGKEGYVLQGKLVTIKKKVYYFMNNGVMKVGWKIDDSGKMYFLADGTRATGLTKVGERYYYFDSKGLMKTGTFTVGENTYYMSDSGVLEVWKSKTEHYDSQNKKMTTVQAEDFETLQRAKAVVAQITNSSMSSSQKLRKCFDWVVSKYYATRRKFTNFEGWPAVYANDHFIYGSGNCQSDAAAFAYLAEALGYKNVYVCADSTGWGLPHSWAEIDGLIYDPLFAEVKGYSRYYGSRYGSNTHSRPIVHIQLS